MSRSLPARPHGVLRGERTDVGRDRDNAGSSTGTGPIGSAVEAEEPVGPDPSEASSTPELSALLARYEAGDLDPAQLAELRRTFADTADAADTARRSTDRSDPPQPNERVVSFRPRSVLTVLGVLMAVAAAIGFAILTSSGLTLIGIAIFLALALNPAVEFFQRRGFRRGLAVVAVYILALAVIALLVLVLIPPMVTQISNLVNAVPGFATKLSQGNGPFGILERRFQVVERVRDLTSGQSFASWTTAALSGLEVVRRVATSFVGTVLIAFLTLFMLLEGPDWRRRLTGLIPDHNRASVERIGSGVYRSVSGFVAGNLLASLVSGVVATVLLAIVGVPYALPLGLFVVIVDLVPYIGPALATLVLTAVALTQGPVSALVVLGVLLGYHVVEGHSLRPLIYGRALRLSPLAVLIAIVLGTELAGILGTLAAIPVAGAIQVGFVEFLRLRAERQAATGGAAVGQSRAR